MPISHRQHGQDKTVLSCPCERCEIGITVNHRLSYVMDTVKNNLKYLEFFYGDWGPELPIPHERPSSNSDMLTMCACERDGYVMVSTSHRPVIIR